MLPATIALAVHYRSKVVHKKRIAEAFANMNQGLLYCCTSNQFTDITTGTTFAGFAL